MNTRSQQLMMDLWVSQAVEPLIPQICDVIRKRFTVLKESSHQFSPQGETIVFILSESHFSIHTYPEHQYFSVDLYICNMTVDLEEVRQEILRICQPTKENYKLVLRGFKSEGIK